MRTFRNLWLGLAVAIALTGLAATSSAEYDFSSATRNGVIYDWNGHSGELTLASDDDAAYAVYDVDGNEVGDGIIDEGSVSFLAGDAGVGPDGTIVYLVLDNEVVAVTDPEWDWN